MPLMLMDFDGNELTIWDRDEQVLKCPKHVGLGANGKWRLKLGRSTRETRDRNAYWREAPSSMRRLTGIKKGQFKALTVANRCDCVLCTCNPCVFLCSYCNTIDESFMALRLYLPKAQQRSVG